MRILLCVTKDILGSITLNRLCGRLRDHDLAVLLCIGRRLSFISSGVLALTTSSPTVLIGQFAATPTIFSLQFAAFSIATITGMLCNHVLVQRFSLSNVIFYSTIAASALCTAILAVAITVGASGVLFILAGIAFAFCSGFVVPNGVMQVMGDDNRCLAGRAAVAGVVEHSIVASVIFLSSLVGTSVEATLSLLAMLAITAAATQVRPMLRESRHRNLVMESGLITNNTHGEK